ncbi:MAG: type II secretion system GspH family protein [Puniceicoccales bacterium]|jgi:prepilin-type N-terminal cleavage/methylation domain-containing protein|nr:type II secretion system GspH family protein [Puniceicoccales bacterium]
MKKRAFTLVEVIVAVAIFGLMSATLLQTVSIIQQALIDARDGADTSGVRRFVLRRVLATASASELEAGATVTLDDNTTVSWSASIEPTEIPDLHRVTVEINWEGDDVEAITLRVFRPAWSDPETRNSLLQNLRDEYPQSRFSTF